MPDAQGAEIYDPVLMPELLATALNSHDERVAVRLADQVVIYRGYREAVSCARFIPGPLEPVRTRPEDVSGMCFTGGTTGRPKGVVSSYRIMAALSQIQMAEWQWPQEVRFLVCAPLSRAAAAFTLPVLLKGGSFVVMSGFSPQGWLAAVEEHRITG